MQVRISHHHTVFGGTRVSFCLSACSSINTGLRDQLDRLWFQFLFPESSTGHYMIYLSHRQQLSACAEWKKQKAACGHCDNRLYSLHCHCIVSCKFKYLITRQVIPAAMLMYSPRVRSSSMESQLPSRITPEVADSNALNESPRPRDGIAAARVVRWLVFRRPDPADQISRWRGLIL